jgi:hypothetical protein
MHDRQNIVARSDPGAAVKYRIFRIDATQNTLKFMS